MHIESQCSLWTKERVFPLHTQAMSSAILMLESNSSVLRRLSSILLRGLKREDYHEFKSSLGYKVNTSTSYKTRACQKKEGKRGECRGRKEGRKEENTSLVTHTYNINSLKAEAAGLP